MLIRSLTATPLGSTHSHQPFRGVQYPELSLLAVLCSRSTFGLCSWCTSPADDEAPPPPWRGNTARRYVSSDTRPQPGSATLKLLNLACELALVGVPVC